MIQNYLSNLLEKYEFREWSQWSKCAVTCQSRYDRDHLRTRVRNCRNKLVEEVVDKCPNENTYTELYREEETCALPSCVNMGTYFKNLKLKYDADSYK